MRKVRILFIAAVLVCVLFPFFFVCASILSGVHGEPPPPPPSLRVINDVTGMNPIEAANVIAVSSVEQVRDLVRAHPGPISIGGGRYSMGGQIAERNSLHFDMRTLNKVLGIDKEKKQVTVQAGATWADIQREIDPLDLSLKIMQSYNNFTVGGSLSVNVHGRYIGYGPIIGSVHSIAIVLANGDLITADRNQNSEIFFGAIGGYGGLGVIVEATLDLADNTRLERIVEAVPVGEYRKYFAEKVRNDRGVVFQNGDLIPDRYDTVQSVVWKVTEKPVTEPLRLATAKSPGLLDKTLKALFMDVPYGIKLRQHLEPLRYLKDAVEWRNFEASYDVGTLGEIAAKHRSYVLQEYFVPFEQFDAFAAALKRVLNDRGVEELNVSARHVTPDEGSLLAWARGEVFAFVLFYRQGTDNASRHETGIWTRELIEEALKLGGSYYLPYQIHATESQFHRAFPRAKEYFALKDRLDPEYKFRNRLFDHYYRPTAEARLDQALAELPTYFRPEDQTYLTLPEWELVYASEALAKLTETTRQSRFPFFTAIKRFWSVDNSVIRKVAPKYPLNAGYHFMNAVIGVNTSVEYALKGAYEKTLGRFFELVGGASSSGDRFIQKTYAEYAAFIRTTPWYEFPFFDRLSALWNEPSPPNDNAIRNYERRAVFSIELAAKGVLGKIFGAATGAMYGADAKEIIAVVEGDYSTVPALVPEARVVKAVDGNLALVSFPRYAAFTEAVRALASAAAPVKFKEIAGNKEIALTYIIRSGREIPAFAGLQLTRYPLLNDRKQERVGISAEVPKLLETVAGIEAGGGVVEHVYDY